MSKKKLDDDELANVSGGSNELEEANLKKDPPGWGRIDPGDGTHLDDPVQHPDVGGGLTAPDID